MIESQLSIRPSRDSDIPFITNSWINTLKYEFPFRYIHEPLPKFFKDVQVQIKLHIQSVPALIAVSIDDDDQIFGYLVYAEDLIHFAYVKEPFRRLGIFRALLQKSAITPKAFTTYTKLTEKVFPNLVYKPKLFMEDPQCESPKSNAINQSHLTAEKI